jgi:hypothetical protein
LGFELVVAGRPNTTAVFLHVIRAGSEGNPTILGMVEVTVDGPVFKTDLVLRFDLSKGLHSGFCDHYAILKKRVVRISTVPLCPLDRPIATHVPDLDVPCLAVRFALVVSSLEKPLSFIETWIPASNKELPGIVSPATSELPFLIRKAYVPTWPGLESAISVLIVPALIECV